MEYSRGVSGYSSVSVFSEAQRQETFYIFFILPNLVHEKNVKNLPGKPDIVLPKYKTVIFINGCFWHGHKGCKYFVVPKTRTEWWLNKIRDTQKRDREAEIQLNVLGWKVISLWTCQLKDKKDNTLQNLIRTIRG